MRRCHLRLRSRGRRTSGRPRPHRFLVTKFEALPNLHGLPPYLRRLGSRGASPRRWRKLNKLDHLRTWCFSIRHWRRGGGDASPTSALRDSGRSWRAPRRRRSRRSAPHAVPSGGGGRREGGRRRSSSPVAFLMPRSRRLRTPLSPSVVPSPMTVLQCLGRADRRGSPVESRARAPAFEAGAEGARRCGRRNSQAKGNAAGRGPE
jgi:hypothetical protein